MKIQGLTSSATHNFREFDGSHQSLLIGALAMQGMRDALDQLVLTEQPAALSDYVSPGIRQSDIGIGFINGIANSRDFAISHVDYLHSLAQGYSVELFYNETDGFLYDLLEAMFATSVDASSREVIQLKEAWAQFDAANKDNPGAKYLQICHSQGGAYVKKALEDSPQEIRDRVIVVNIAIATIIPSDLCYQSYNYASENDYINLAEMFRAYDPNLTTGLHQWARMYENRDEILWLKGSVGPWWIPGMLYQLYYMHHEFRDPVFQEVIADRIADYLENNGGYC